MVIHDQAIWILKLEWWLTPWILIPKTCLFVSFKTPNSRNTCWTKKWFSRNLYFESKKLLSNTIVIAKLKGVNVSVSQKKQQTTSWKPTVNMQQPPFKDVSSIKKWWFSHWHLTFQGSNFCHQMHTNATSQNKRWTSAFFLSTTTKRFGMTKKAYCAAS